MSHLIAPAMDEPEPLRMSYEEYLNWYDEGRRGEWVNGEVIEFLRPALIHQLLLGFLVRLLAGYVERFDLGAVILGPCELWLAAPPAARTPDMMFVAQTNLHRIGENRVVGPVDLVVEVVSEDSKIRDTRDKFDQYGAAGIREYWLVDSRPGRRHSAFYHLDGDGRYRLAPLDAADRYYSLVVPGFWLEPAWLWQDPLPKINELMTNGPQIGEGGAG